MYLGYTLTILLVTAWVYTLVKLCKIKQLRLFQILCLTFIIYQVLVAVMIRSTYRQVSTQPDQFDQKTAHLYPTQAIVAFSVCAAIYVTNYWVLSIEYLGLSYQLECIESRISSAEK